MVSLETVTEAIKGWLVRFKDRKSLDGASLTLFAVEYMEDLNEEGVSENEFVEMNKLVRRRCRFFPQMVDILDTREDAAMILKSRVVQIPYNLPEPKGEDREKCLAIIERTAKELGIKLSI